MPLLYRFSSVAMVLLMLTDACRESRSDNQEENVDNGKAIATAPQMGASSGTVEIGKTDDLVLEETRSIADLGTSTPVSDGCTAAYSDWHLYTVESGDSLQSIASSTGSSVEQLLQENCLEDPGSIHAGLMLRVPSLPIAQLPTVTAVPPISSTLFLTPPIGYDTDDGYLLEAGQTVVVRWTASADLPANNQLEIAYHPEEMPAESIAVLIDVSGDVDVQWEVPSWTSGTIVATLLVDLEGQDLGDVQVVQIRFQSFPGCLFAPYGIGGDVPVRDAADINSAVIGHVSSLTGERYPVVGAGGEWRIEDAGISGQFYQILLDEATIGWVQDIRGAVEGDCSTYRKRADIELFEVSPSTLYAGETVSLHWRASGVSAEICPTARYTYFTSDDCQSVPLRGSLQFEMPADLQPSYAPGFRLHVEGNEGTESQQQYVYVNLYCESAWFYDSEQPAGPICPQQAIGSWAAVQHFEHGTMIWLEALGRYYVFSPQPLDQTPINQHKLFNQINDPLTVVDDTSNSYTPPDGFYAPESGFGYVWRGDVAESPPLREVLGWATAPEFGYQASFQCGDFTSTQFGSTCYLSGPENELIWIDGSYNRRLRIR